MKKNFYIFLALMMSHSLLAQSAFITRWNLATTGSGATQLSFGVGTSGIVNYTWTTVPAGTTGSGTLTGSTATITGLPTGATIDLSILPTNFQRININNGTDRSRLTGIQQWGDVAWTSMANAFHGCDKMVLNATDVPNTAAVTDMSSMFYGCSAFNQAFPMGFNTATVKTMKNMFYGCGAYNQALPSSFNTANVTDMSYMFDGCATYNKALPSNFNTAAVTTMKNMFNECGVYNQALPSSFNTAAVTDMAGMFQFCNSYNQALPSSFNTAKVTNMNSMFVNCGVYNQPLPSSFNTEKVTNMTQLFFNCAAYNQPLPTSFSTAVVTNMTSMFRGCRAYNQPLPSSFNTENVTNMNGMFANTRSFNQNFGHLNIMKVTDMIDIFNNSGILRANYDSILIAWNTAGYTNKNLGNATPLTYCAGQTARTSLTTTKGWTITGDTYNCSTAVTTLTDVTELQQNRPNPFSQETLISFTLPDANKAVLTVYDITGREVLTLNERFNAGINEVTLNKSIFQTTGTYFYRLTTDKGVAVKKLQFIAE